jgi:hypothetical protein
VRARRLAKRFAVVEPVVVRLHSVQIYAAS